MMEKLVSIVVPVYNVEKYLLECIESLKKQTYKNIEIILVDDGSKDSSGKLCDEISKTDTRIKVVHKENEGLGFARNTGLEYVNGEFVIFFDSDDFADEDFVKNLAYGIFNSGADTCVGSFKRVSEDGKNVVREFCCESRIYEGEDVHDKFFMRMLGSAPEKHDSIRMSVWSTIYSMEIITKYKIRFPSERVMMSEDIIFNEEYYRYAQKVNILNVRDYNYRISQGSLTTKYMPNRLNRVCDLYVEMEKRVQKRYTEKEAIYRLQRQFFVNLISCYRQIFSCDERKKILSGCKEVSIINKHPVVSRVVHEYPIRRIQFKQRVFLTMIKYKMTFPLAFLAKTGGF